MDRSELVEKLLDLAATILKQRDELGKVERERDAYLENLTNVQRRCTQLVDEVRGLRGLFQAQLLRHMLPSPAHMLEVLIQVVSERWRQDSKHDPPREIVRKARERGEGVHHGTGIVGDDDRAIEAKAIVDESAKTPRGASMRDILEEEVCEAFAEVDPDKMRAELVQVAALAVKWIQVIDLERT